MHVSVDICVCGFLLTHTIISLAIIGTPLILPQPVTKESTREDACLMIGFVTPRILGTPLISNMELIIDAYSNMESIIDAMQYYGIRHAPL